MHLSQSLEEIFGQDGKVEGVRLRSREDGSKEILPVDGVFIFIGVDPQSRLVVDLAKLNREGFVEVDCNGFTGIPGLHAAGDVTNFELKR